MSCIPQALIGMEGERFFFGFVIPVLVSIQEISANFLCELSGYELKNRGILLDAVILSWLLVDLLFCGSSVNTF